MSQVTEQIKARLSIADVVSGYLKLDRAGANMKGRCPFHSEKSASFFVSPARESYHCFGCNRGGDIFSFVQEMEGLDFRGALKVLAERAGVELVPMDPKKATERERLYGVLEAATRHFEENLAKSPRVREYLKERGLTDETIKTFRIGYAKDEWRDLSLALQKKGYTDALMESAGLAIRTDKGHYDRFRGRAMFPILDSSGRAIAFSGRILPDAEKADANAKYINSPETEVYQKSRTLYGLDKAKQAIRRAGAVVLVEGQMDLVMSHQVGVDNAVAVSGTALTEEHLGLLKRLAEKIIFAFDADDAGVAASRRGVDMALRLGFDVRAARISGGKDPADVAKEHPEAWREAVASAEHIIEFYLASVLAHEKDERTRRVKAGEAVLPYVAALENSIDKAHFIARLASELRMREEPLWEELKKEEIKRRTGASAQGAQSSAVPGGEKIARTRKDRIARNIVGLIFWQESLPQSVLTPIELRAKIGVFKNEYIDALLSAGGDTQKDLVFEAEVQYEGDKNLVKEANELLQSFEEEILREQLMERMERLREAEQAGKSDDAAALLSECRDISGKLNNLKKTGEGLK